MIAHKVKKVSVSISRIVTPLEESVGGENLAVDRFREAYRLIRHDEPRGQLHIDLRIDLTKEE